MQKLIVGLDIGTNVIKAVQMSREKDKNVLIAAGSIPEPTKTSKTNDDEQEQAIANSINRLVREMKISTTDVVASLPSVNVVNQVVEMPNMKSNELNSSISWEAEQYIPLPLSKVQLDFDIIEKNPEINKMKVLLVAAPIDYIKKYMRIITLAGLNPLAFETEVIALNRIIYFSYPDLSNLIAVQLGATNTLLILIHNGVLVYTKTMPFGGTSLVRAVSQELGFGYAQAEEYIKTYGLEQGKLEGKIVKLIIPFINDIFGEIEKIASYFKNQYPKEEIKNVILSGGISKLPGFVLTLTKNIGIDSQIIDPFINIEADPNFLTILANDAPIYSTAVGLALKEI